MDRRGRRRRAEGWGLAGLGLAGLGLAGLRLVGLRWGEGDGRVMGGRKDNKCYGVINERGSKVLSTSRSMNVQCRCTYIIFISYTD